MCPSSNLSKIHFKLEKLLCKRNLNEIYAKILGIKGRLDAFIK